MALLKPEGPVIFFFLPEMFVMRLVAGVLVSVSVVSGRGAQQVTCGSVVKLVNSQHKVGLANERELS